MHEAGDRVLVETSDETIEGTLMPSEGNVVLKLKSGYNIGISKDRIKKISLLSKHLAVSEEKARHIAREKSKKSITILHTGGTIASKVDYETGAVIARFSPEEIISMFPELKDIANVDSKLIAQMWSDDMRFEHYQKMAHAVEEELKKNVDGIIITHGTDTLGYSAAALAFMCEIPIPVILVGAQRSSDRGSSDAAMNLICAAEFVAKTDFAGIAICMHENMDDNNCVILPPTKTRKMHASRRDAFKAVNDIPIARINYKTRKIEFLREHKKRSAEAWRINPKMEDKIALIKIHTNMKREQFDVYQGYKGLVIEGTGLGHAPVGLEVNKPIMEGIIDLIKSGTLVAMTSQCIYGRTHSHVYSNAVKLANAGVIYCEDTLPETAFIKLAWLLGNYKKKEAASLMAENLRGEISDRSAE
ncbi:MAG TPA: Glu-tRNA(Gln) amidotransferase subunit GatD [Candidatus Nanoarchaeia archaeon]|nr:Glu-tRNA(Gln) amidotransferase subunit GatD [Candidatus Nanoarchaeia archaeon]